ncbi:MAG: histidine--tRNA ligase [Ruminococcaceae bacterium]|nr:histidine--tRNA ligase [Oscillospiraceae bacterium]
MAEIIRAPKGTHDVLPSDVHKWHYLEKTLRGVAAAFNFREIRFPTFEHTELFIRGVGDTTDVVQKEMYTFEDKGGRSITLRPEGTASVVRSLVESGLITGALPVKCYYIAPNFRYEKPQAGRLRQHHQFGVECFGSAAPEADAEVISLADTFLHKLGINDITVHINSIGCPHCRPQYHAALKEYFRPHLSEMCETCQERFERNPMRLLDCKSPICKEIAKNAPTTLDYLCDDCRTHFNRTLELLDVMGVNYEVDTGIVRGLDYYTGPVFEFVSNNIGAQGTVCGGGRYNGLVEQLGGKPTPALGFGSGLERLLLVMEALGVEIPNEDGCDIYFAPMGAAASDAVQKLTLLLRREGIAAERDLCARSVKAQMKYADKLGARYTAVIGDDEIASGVIRIKDMISGEQTECALNAEAIAAVVR